LATLRQPRPSSRCRQTHRNKIKESRIFEFQLIGQEKMGMAVLGFGQDASGELYLLANSTGVPFGDTGVVLRIVPGQ
jgi:hypothetical protein